MEDVRRKMFNENKNKKTKRYATKRGIATTKRSEAPTKTGQQAVRKQKWR